MPVSHATSSPDMMAGAFQFLKGVQAVGIRCFPWLFEGKAFELFGLGKQGGNKELTTGRLYCD